jgi:hypothetical protein
MWVRPATTRVVLVGDVGEAGAAVAARCAQVGSCFLLATSTNSQGRGEGRLTRYLSLGEVGEVATADFTARRRFSCTRQGRSTVSSRWSPRANEKWWVRAEMADWQAGHANQWKDEEKCEREAARWGPVVDARWKEEVWAARVSGMGRPRRTRPKRGFPFPFFFFFLFSIFFSFFPNSDFNSNLNSKFVANLSSHYMFNLNIVWDKFIYL